MLKVLPCFLEILCGFITTCWQCLAWDWDTNQYKKFCFSCLAILFEELFAFLLAFFEHRLGGRGIQWLLPYHLLLIYGGHYVILFKCASTCCLHQEMDCMVQDKAFHRSSWLPISLKNNFCLESALFMMSIDIFSGTSYKQANNFIEEEKNPLLVCHVLAGGSFLLWLVLVTAVTQKSQKFCLLCCGP